MELHANELRIGNYLELLGNTIQVETISNLPARKEMYWIGSKEIIDTKIIHFKPILITEDWVIKFGFKKRKFKHLFYWEKKIIISQFASKTGGHFSIKTGFDIRFTPELTHVHQLQNLYFALTGTELTLIK